MPVIPPTVSSQDDFPIVGLGASAGCIDALKAFFLEVPEDSGIAYVLVVPLTGKHSGILLKLLQSTACIPVSAAEDNQIVQPNHAYVIPPDREISIHKGKLQLMDILNTALRRPIDTFLKSLAQELERNAAAVILTGTGKDGTLGVRKIKSMGGLVLVQSELSADIIVPPQEMPQRIMHWFARTPGERGIDSTEIDTIFEDNELCVHRFMPGTSMVINLKQNTTGRPLEQVLTNLSFDEFIAELQKGLHKLTPREQDLLPADVCEKLSRAIAEVIKTSEVRHFEYGVTIDGTALDYEVRVVKIGNGEITAAIRDITNHRRAENTLRDRSRIRMSVIDIPERKKMENELNRRALELKHLSAQLRRAHEDERAIIARELHDEFGQALTAVKINISRLESELTEQGSTDVMKRIRETSELTDGLLEQVRDLALNLRPSMLDDLGLVAALNWYVRGFSRRTGVKCKLQVVGREVLLCDERRIMIYRVVQETLTNVARHAKAKSAGILLRFGTDTLTVEVKDDGIGFNVEEVFAGQSEKYPIGLLGMRESTEELGGTWHIQSKADQGSSLTITIPLEDLQ
jgi:signal transduction histidine kinase